MVYGIWNTLASTCKIMKFSKGKKRFACLANNKSNNSHTEPKGKEEREQAIKRRKTRDNEKGPRQAHGSEVKFPAGAPVLQ